MRQNPAYFLLKEHPSIMPYQLIDKQDKPYLLIDLRDNSTEFSTDLQLQHKTHSLVEHHLSIYRMYDIKEKKGLSAFHYTAVYPNMIVRAYFDHCGEYQYCTAKNLDGDLITLDRDDEKHIRKQGEAQLRKPLGIILTALYQLQEEMQQKVKRALSWLEEKSRAGVLTAEYLQLLDETIQLVEMSLSKRFVTDTHLKTLLVKQRAHLHRTLQPKPESKKSATSVSDTKESDSTALVVDTVSTSSSSSNSYAEKDKKLLLKQFKAANSMAVAKRFSEQAVLLKKLWLACDPSDVDFAIRLNQLEETFHEHRRAELILSCRKGDLALVKELLHESADALMIPGLCTMAAINHHPALFDYLYRKCQLKSMLTTMPIMLPEELITPAGAHALLYGQYEPLFLALYHDDFEFFCSLLDEYQIDPDLCYDALGDTLLVYCARANRLKYLEKLLQAGANPNSVIKKRVSGLYMMGSQHATKALSEGLQAGRDQLMRLSRNGVTAIYLAARDQNEPMVSLLLRYGANTHLRAEDGFNAFGTAGPHKNKSMSVANFKQIQAAGHHAIDERLGSHHTTLLLLAVQYEQPEAVALLLTMGADPLLKSKTPDGHDMTPFARAAAGGMMAILQLIVDHCKTKNQMIDAKELQRALIYGDGNPNVKALLQPLYTAARQAQFQSYQQEGHTFQAARLYHDIFRKTPENCEVQMLLQLGKDLLAEASKLATSEGETKAEKQQAAQDLFRDAENLAEKLQLPDLVLQAKELLQQSMQGVVFTAFK